MRDPANIFNPSVEFDFNSDSAKMENLIKKYSKNYHKNLLDLNVRIDIKKLRVARMLHHVENKLHHDVTDYTLRLKKFKSNIKSDEGKLGLGDLQKLNSVYKRNYVQQIMKENFEVNGYLQHVDENVLDK